MKKMKNRRKMKNDQKTKGNYNINNTGDAVWIKLERSTFILKNKNLQESLFLPLATTRKNMETSKEKACIEEQEITDLKLSARQDKKGQKRNQVLNQSRPASKLKPNLGSF